LKAKKKTKVVDATGKTIIPGLIDMHGHMYAMGLTQMDAYPGLYLAGGVTTVFSPGEMEPEKTLKLKAEIIKGERIGPNILFAGPYFDTEPSIVPWIHAVSDTAMLSDLFKKWKDDIDGIKIYSKISREHFDLVMQKAKQQGLLVTGHLGTLTTRYAVESGINGLEHGLFSISDFGGDPNDMNRQACHVAKLDLGRDDVISLVDLIVSKKVYVDPTLVVLESFSLTSRPLVKDLDYFLDDRATIVQKGHDQWLASQFDLSCMEKQFQKQLQFCKMIFDRGGILVTGTDPVSLHLLPGFGIKREIILLMQAGIPLEDAIKIASLNAAKVLGISEFTGSIEIGKNADLSLLDGDVTTNSDILYKTKLTMKKGIIYDSHSLLKSLEDKVHSGY
jgi:enamidase